MSRGALTPIFRSFQRRHPRHNFVKQGRWQHYDPVPFFRSEAPRWSAKRTPRDFQPAAPETERKQTLGGLSNPKSPGMVKQGDSANKRLLRDTSNSMILVSCPNRQNPRWKRFISPVRIICLARSFASSRARHRHHHDGRIARATLPTQFRAALCLFHLQRRLSRQQGFRTSDHDGIQGSVYGVRHERLSRPLMVRSRVRGVSNQEAWIRPWSVDLCISLRLAAILDLTSPRAQNQGRTQGRCACSRICFRFTAASRW
jgi:hypothetical protein